MKKFLSLVLGLVLTTGLVTGCATNTKKDEANSETKTEATSEEETTGTETSGEKKMTIGYVNWSEGVAMTNLAAAILEDKMGYDVDLVLADAAPIFTSMASGNTDVFLDTWLPVTHADYLNEYGDDIVDLGVSYENALIGLVVPSYVEANSIEDLNDSKDLFDGKIIGIDSGAGIMSATEKAIEDYNLDFELISGSGPAMTASLKKAIDNNKAIVVTGWTPHWMFSRWDLKVLEDPKGVYGDSENIHIYSRKGFEEDLPDAAELLKNFKFSDEVLSDLMGAIEDSDKDPLDVAKEWANSHEDQVNEWLGK